MTSIHFSQAASFQSDLALLAENYQPIVLTSGDNRLAVLAEFQGRAMVSSMTGDQGDSIGWFDRELLKQDLSEIENLNVGGVSRLWFGPEKGPYALFFKPGTAQVAETVHYQPAITTVAFDIVNQTPQQVTFEQDIRLINHMETEFNFHVSRTLHLFDTAELAKSLAVTIPEGIQAIGFSASTTLTNTANQALSRQTGLVSIWELGCFYPNATIAIPLSQPLAEVTSYFTPTKASHTNIVDDTVFYNADASYMNKIGIAPEYTKPIMGSYNAELNLLTIVKFQFEPPADGSYVNSVWQDDVDPYGGDVTNIFNYGLLENGRPGPFYELETSSHARELAVGERLSHYHNTYHFSGDQQQLSKLSKALLGVSLQQLQQAFSKSNQSQP
ncbi:hypothetical protein IC617_15845 [Neiella sp. HB171785]|uniref:Uncharacterized protein n=1 Tax=Neiella litorisoli TaxID=2771431 RepID=A0A8J6UJN5_9GAMM|nr:DUF6786 family protein [Neiella litorisoli]MBD1390903.1 hypothetical protein [Neiella litorisoli]